MRRPPIIGIFGGAAALLILIYFALSPRTVTERQAGELLGYCLSHGDAGKGCHRVDSATWTALERQPFRFEKSGTAPRLVYFDYVSADRRFCAHAEFGTDSLSGYRSADFYRCANRHSASIGIG